MIKPGDTILVKINAKTESTIAIDLFVSKGKKKSAPITEIVSKAIDRTFRKRNRYPNAICGMVLPREDEDINYTIVQELSFALFGAQERIQIHCEII